MTYLAHRICFVLFFLSTLGAAQAMDASNEPARAELVEKVIATAEAKVANPRWLDGPEWQQFTQLLRDPETQALDDAEFRRAFNEAARDLPFTHFALRWQQPRGAGKAEPMVALDWPRKDVARLSVRMFAGNPAEFAKAMDEVIAAAPAALLIDLRGNPGGSFPTAVALVRKLINEPMDSGAWLSRVWFDRHGDVPNAEQYASITALEKLDMAAYLEKLYTEGATRLMLPAHNQPIFDGRVMILADGRTGSTCEPLIDRLQAHGIEVVGERTAGAMLNGHKYPLDETFQLFLPSGDYVTPDLVRLDRNGVAPDIAVPGEQALERALEMLGRGDAS
jgi:carboxyl-terminal processing protease